MVYLSLHTLYHVGTLSKPQKKIVEERVRAIQAKFPICVAVMKNNNGVAQKWMLVSSNSSFGIELCYGPKIARQSQLGGGLD